MSPEIIYKTSTSLQIRLPQPRPKKGCTRPVPLPTTEYVITYRTASGDAHLLCLLESISCITKHYYSDGNALDRIVELNQLNPNTEYIVQVKMQNIYTRNIENMNSKTINEKGLLYTSTLDGPPSYPRSLSAEVLSPSSVLVTWEEPEIKRSNQIVYEVHWQSDEYISGQIMSSFTKTDGFENIIKKKRSQILNDLNPATEYTIWVIAKSENGVFDNTSISEKISVKTFTHPNKIIVLDKGPRFIRFIWKAPDNTNVQKHSVIYFPQKEIDSVPRELEQRIVNNPGEKFAYTIKDLSPGTCYVIKVKVVFISRSSKPFIWPQDNNTCIETEEDVPRVPGIPYITESSSGQLIVTWKENNDKISLYQLQNKEETSEEAEWKDLYANHENKFVASGLNGTNFFRVRASNSFGYGEFSKSSPPYDIQKIRLNYLNSKSEKNIITISTRSICVTGFLLFILIVLCMIN